MTEANLKAVLTFDEETSTFNPVAHNLSAEKAEEKASELQSEGIRVQILDQPSRHKGGSHTSCKLCKNAAENLSQKQPEDPAEDENNEDAAVADGNVEE